MDVNVELLDNELVVENFLAQILIDEVALGEYIEYHLFLLLHRALNSKDGVQLIYMEVNRLSVV